ncbi:hypothetical protein LRHMDP2_2128 [Lacticaseibacillus rhamnosus LRHMDP2]|uniref:Mobile element protein n=1 Tax=Lacticaseibacillus rhamnosus LRHMDP3 TaxID=1203259 RepID=A0AB33XWG8_LACRH|nr:hypothetical protein LRHMDP2_2128 [Lacticaseibacillus rhamnosus LRHMDP2]EKS52209.1 hypothetical protein LRHMDP3_580 [Lacticaseibacillus rhamnosus LRHMDP3]
MSAHGLNAVPGHSWKNAGKRFRVTAFTVLVSRVVMVRVVQERTD